MINIFIVIALPFVFIWLFFRECRLEKKHSLENARKGDLHMLKEIKKFYIEHDIEVTEDLERSIKELE